MRTTATMLQSLKRETSSCDRIDATTGALEGTSCNRSSAKPLHATSKSAATSCSSMRVAIAQARNLFMRLRAKAARTWTEQQLQSLKRETSSCDLADGCPE